MCVCVIVCVIVCVPPAPEGTLFWDNPTKVGTFDPSCGCYRGESWGWRNFIKHFDLQRRSYLKNDDLIIFVDFEGEQNLNVTSGGVVCIDQVQCKLRSQLIICY